MKVKYEGKYSDSNIYRILFELAKQEGAQTVSQFISDLNYIDGDSIKEDAILYGKNPLISIIRKYKNIVAYLRNFKDELDEIDFSDEGLRKTFRDIGRHPELLDDYIENVRKLEELKVSQIVIDYEFMYRDFSVDFERDNNGKITLMRKIYTDGLIHYYNYSPQNNGYYLNSKLDESAHTTFLLLVDNDKLENQTRKIIIKDFWFDASKLPTEEEMQSLELPQTLKLYLKK